MPMDFPDLQSLKDRAKGREFRQPNEGETEADYREALASHIAPIDPIESMEIRNSVGWDKWSPQQKFKSLFIMANRGK